LASTRGRPKFGQPLPQRKPTSTCSRGVARRLRRLVWSINLVSLVHVEVVGHLEESDGVFFQFLIRCGGF